MASWINRLYYPSALASPRSKFPIWIRVNWESLTILWHCYSLPDSGPPNTNITGALLTLTIWLAAMTFYTSSCTTSAGGTELTFWINFLASNSLTMGIVSFWNVSNLFWIVSALSSALPDVSPLFINLCCITSLVHSKNNRNLTWMVFPMILFQLSQLSKERGKPSNKYLPVFPF